MPNLPTVAQFQEGTSVKHINRFAILLKRLLIAAASLAVILFVYVTFIPDVWRRTNLLFALIVLWFVTAYLVLPRIHRLLSRFYVPSNFIGRARTSDGLLADPINLGLRGGKRELIAAMEAAGWERAEPLTPRSVWRAMRTNALRQSYPTAPVSTYILFGKPQELAFQMEVDNTTHKRHHVRFWRTPRNWYLPGGHRVDWVGASTYDMAARFSLFTMQFTHKIDADVDKERDFLVDTLRNAGKIRRAKRIEHFFNAYSTRNGDGYHYITDGSMVIAELKEQ